MERGEILLKFKFDFPVAWNLRFWKSGDELKSFYFHVNINNVVQQNVRNYFHCFSCSFFITSFYVLFNFLATRSFSCLLTSKTKLFLYKRPKLDDVFLNLRKSIQKCLPKIGVELKKTGFKPTFGNWERPVHWIGRSTSRGGLIVKSHTFMDWKGGGGGKKERKKDFLFNFNSLLRLRSIFHKSFRAFCSYMPKIDRKRKIKWLMKWKIIAQKGFPMKYIYFYILYMLLKREGTLRVCAWGIISIITKKRRRAYGDGFLFHFDINFFFFLFDGWLSINHEKDGREIP